MHMRIIELDGEKVAMEFDWNLNWLCERDLVSNTPCLERHVVQKTDSEILARTKRYI